MAFYETGFMYFPKKETNVKKVLFVFAIFVGLVMLFPVVSLAQEADISGTWTGTTTVPDSADLDQVALVLETAGEGYMGTISDSFGLAVDEELVDIEFNENTLSFHFSILVDYDYQRIDVILTVERDRMEGSWTNEAGDSASIVLERER